MENIISSEIDTSDEDSSDLDITDIKKNLEAVELQLMQKQDFAQHIVALSEFIDDNSSVSILSNIN